MGFPIFIRLFFTFILERVRNVFVHHKEHKSNPVRLVLFLWGISGLCDFSKIAPRFHRANPFGLTLTLLRKRPGRFLRIPLSPPVRIQVEPLNLYSFFMLWVGLKFHDAIKRLVDKYVCNFVVTRNSR